jgi:glycerol-3-phosphate dehydrogenase
VVIVGAGINGIGTFRDLALNGVDVLLIDRADFCSGASAASSHMAHGGIRYLENGEFRLVREAVRERNRLLLNAPHVVRPLPTTYRSSRSSGSERLLNSCAFTAGQRARGNQAGRSFTMRIPTGGGAA